MATAAVTKDGVSSVVSHRLRLESIARSLSQLSIAAKYFALQVKNNNLELLESGIPEMEQHLRDAVKLTKKF